MEKAKKSPWWLVLKIFIIIIAIVVFLFVGIYAFIRISLGIDIFQAIGKLKLLSKTPQIEKIIDYGYTSQDLDAGLIQFDNAGLSVVYTKNGDNITIDPKHVTDIVTMTGDLQLTDKQLAAVANCYLKSAIGSVAIDEDLSLEDLAVSQLKIYDVQTLAGGYTSAKVNVVVQVGLKELKDSLNVFPVNLITKYLPETLYINSTSTITMTSDFLHTVEYESFTLNNLSAENSTYLVNLINKFFNIGTVQDLGKNIGEYVTDILIGDVNSTEGFAYAFRPAGAKSCHFKYENNIGYFVISLTQTQVG